MGSLLLETSQEHNIQMPGSALIKMFLMCFEYIQGVLFRILFKVYYLLEQYVLSLLLLIFQSMDGPESKGACK